MTDVHGSNDPRFQSVRELFDRQLSSGNELGASLCVNLDGKTVVDLWGGYTTEARTAPWTEDTIVPVWSSSKCVTNFAALMLIDRGVLDPNARVSQYWPEFAANGKQDIKVRHILSHTAGIPSWELPWTKEDLFNNRLATERLVDLTPWWTPGTASGYHVVTQGHLVGELVRRITGKSLGQFIREEIASPLDADFQLGAEEKDWPRCAEAVAPADPPLPDKPVDMNSIPVRIAQALAFKADDSNSPGFRKTEMGAVNAVSNARGLNRILSVITQHGMANGRQFLSPETVDLIFNEQISGIDLFLGVFLRMGLGYGLSSLKTVDWFPEGKVCYWGGWGGSVCIMDLDRKVTITYALNRMGNGLVGNDRTEAYVREIYAVLDRITAQ